LPNFIETCNDLAGPSPQQHQKQHHYLHKVKPTMFQIWPAQNLNFISSANKVSAWTTWPSIAALSSKLQLVFVQKFLTNKFLTNWT